MKKKITEGDIFKVKTRQGDAFVQFVHTRADEFDVMRAFSLEPSTTENRDVADICKVVDRSVSFWFLTSAAAVLEHPAFSKVGNVMVPKDTLIPIFRGWLDGPLAFLVDSDGKSTRVNGFDAEMRKYPVYIGIPPVAIIEQIETGWTPERDLQERMGGVSKTRHTSSKRSLRRRVFFTARTEQSATLLADILAGRGFDTNVKAREADWEIEISFGISDNMAENEKAEAACNIVAESVGAEFLASEQDV